MGDRRLTRRRRINDKVAGLAQLLVLLVRYGDSAEDPMPVSIETPRELLTAYLRATGRQWPVQPVSGAVRMRVLRAGIAGYMRPLHGLS